MAIADRMILSDETPFHDARFDKPLVLSHRPGEQDLSRVTSHAGVPLFYQHVGADTPASPENHYGRFTSATVENLALAVDFEWSESNPSAMLAYAQRCETTEGRYAVAHRRVRGRAVQKIGFARHGRPLPRRALGTGRRVAHSDAGNHQHRPFR